MILLSVIALAQFAGSAFGQGAADNPFGLPVPTFPAQPEPPVSAPTLPAKEKQFFVYRLKNRAADSAAVMLTKVLDRGSISIAVDGPQNQLLVRAEPGAIEQIKQLLDILDQPPAQTEQPQSGGDVQRAVVNVAAADEAAFAIDRAFPKNEVQVTAVPGANILIVTGRRPLVEEVVQFMRQLEQVQRETEDFPTLQVRLIWLADNLPDGVGSNPAPNQLDPRVIESLGRIGFSRPKIVFQHVASVTLERDRGRVEFQSPVILGGNDVSFQGDLRLGRSSGDRYSVSLNAAVSTKVALGGVFDASREPAPFQDLSGSVTGSITMPLRHYVVVGTSNIILAGEEGRESYQAALVAFLDYARPTTPAAIALPDNGDRGRGRGRGDAGRGGAGGSDDDDGE
jgi:hypothetical protein